MNAQELIIGHLLPIAATVAVLWLVYRLLFRNSNRLKFNRFFLLMSMLLALAMPLLGLLSGMEMPQMVTLKRNMFNGMMLSEVIVTPDGQPVLPEVTVTTDATPSRFSVWQVIGGIYLVGVGVMTLLFLIKLGRLGGAHHPFAEAQDGWFYSGVHGQGSRFVFLLPLCLFSQ